MAFQLGYFAGAAAVSVAGMRLSLLGVLCVFRVASWGV
jgi:hypothetical protein